MTIRRALITGITGQDGSYLAELLLAKGYEVHGIVRRASAFNTERIDHIYQDPHQANARLFLHYGDLSTTEQLTNLIYNLRPDEVYHLGAQSHVQVSFEIPEYTGDVTGLTPPESLMLCAVAGAKPSFIKLPVVRCSVTPLRPRVKKRLFNPAAPMR